MATLNFTQGADGLYVATATINDSVALHIEREVEGVITIRQRSTASGKYAKCFKEDSVRKSTLDTDIVGTKFPKYLQITSTGAISSAEIIE